MFVPAYATSNETWEWTGSALQVPAGAVFSVVMVDMDASSFYT
jgi:hypothetical protein